MDESNLRVVRVVGGQILQVPGDGIDQRAVEIATTGMDYHACGLVDDHDFIVLIDHLEWDILWSDGRVVVRTVEHQGDDIARTHLVVTLHRPGTASLFDILGRTDMDETCVGCLLDTVAAGVRLVLGEELIDANRFIELTVIRLLIGISIGHQFQFFIIYVVQSSSSIFQFFNFSILSHSTTSSNSSTLPLSIRRYSGSI